MRSPLQRLGRLLLRVLPREFRDRFGDDIADHFSTRSREARASQGRLGVVVFWIKSIVDVARAGVAERREERELRREVDDGSAFSDLGQDVRYALRTLRRTPGFTAVALVTLALGIGATTAMFSVMNAAMGRALPYPEPERLVMGRATFSGSVNPWVAFPDYQDYRDQAESLESLATHNGGASLVTVTGSGEPEQVRLTFATPNLFETLGVIPALGNTFTIDELPQSGPGEVVISHGFWQNWFGGEPDAVGRTLTVDGSSVTVVGVLPEGFRFLYDTDLWVPPWPGNSDPITRNWPSGLHWVLAGRGSPANCWWNA